MQIPDKPVNFRWRLGNKALGAPKEFWIEADLANGWLVAYRVLPQAGRPVIVELRLFPSERSASRPIPGQWSGAITHVPDGGISTRLVRSFPVGSHIDQGLKDGNLLLKLIPRARPRFRAAGFEGLKRARAPRRAPASAEDRRLEAAAFYVEHGGRRPVKNLAAAWTLTPKEASNLLQAATKHGLLTKGTRGKASRALTEKAKQLLATRRTRS